MRASKLVGGVLILAGVGLIAMSLISPQAIASLAFQFAFGEIDYPTEAEFGDTVTITVTFTKPVDDSMESKVWLVDEGLVIADSYYHQLFPDIYADFPEIADGVRQISLTMPNHDWHLTLRAIAEDGSKMGEGFYIYLEEAEPETHMLNVLVSPTGAGVVKWNQSGWLDFISEELVAGTEVQITVWSLEYYEFDAWSGDVWSTDNSITVTMDADKTIQANFEPSEEPPEPPPPPPPPVEEPFPEEAIVTAGIGAVMSVAGVVLVIKRK